MVIYKYCTQCGRGLNLSEEYPRCEVCDITYYKNSKPCASVLPIKNGKVLLAKRAIEPYKNEFDIIGGFLEEGEHPEDGARREVKEETGLDVKIIDLLGIYPDRYGEDGDFTLSIHYIGEVVSGKIKAQGDVASLHWVPINKLPTNVGFKNTREALNDLKALYRKKDLK